MTGFDGNGWTPPEMFIDDFLGERVRVAPCSNPDHIALFEAGFMPVSCRVCVMEVVPKEAKE